MEIKRGYLYLADLSPRFGTEAGKLRPVLVMQTDYLNSIGHPSTWVLPCTTKLRGDNLLRISIPRKLAGNDEGCEIMIDQPRAIDNKRFKKQLKPIPKLIMAEIRQKFLKFGGLL